jgi:lipopolysaccharide transport system permease protein
LFTGLIVFYIFSECIGRAPSLLNENPSYVKRVVFPLEALAWVLVLSATFNAVVSFGILLLAHLVMVGLPPVTIIWLPLILLPFVIMMTGVVWFLSSTGLYVRDIRQLVGVIIPILMFISPVFYPTSALPVGMQRYMYLNPLAFMIEQVRNVALFGIAPNLAGLALFTVLSVIVAWAGLVWLLLTKRGFADVI